MGKRHLYLTLFRQICVACFACWCITDLNYKQATMLLASDRMSIEGHQDYSGMYCAVLTIG